MQLFEQCNLLVEKLRPAALAVEQGFPLIPADARVIEIQRDDRVCVAAFPACRDQERLTPYDGRDVGGIPAIVPQKQVLIRFETHDGGGEKATGIRVLGKEYRVAALDIPELHRVGHRVHGGIAKRRAVARPDSHLPVLLLVQDFVLSHSGILLTRVAQSF